MAVRCRPFGILVYAIWHPAQCGRNFENEKVSCFATANPTQRTALQQISTDELFVARE
jgi:hypothetical protein